MLKLSCGISRKVGEPNFGSRGASLSIELELEGQAINDPPALRQRIESLFLIARQAVEQELGQSAARHNAGPLDSQNRPSDEPPTEEFAEEPEVAQPADLPPANRLISARQMDFILTLARSRHLSNQTMAQLCQEAGGVDDLAQLTRPQASEVIDRLQRSNGELAEPRRRAGSLSRRAR